MVLEPIGVTIMSSEFVRLSEHKEKAFMKRVDTLIQYGAYEKAIGCCDQFIEANPEVANAYVIKHEIHINMQKYEESLQDINKLLHNRRYERKGLFLKLLSLSLLLEKSRLRLVSGSSLEKETSYAQELKKTAEKALIHYEGDTQIVYMIVEGYQLIGMKDEAIELLEEHLRIKPWDVHCLYQLGLIYQESGQYEKALEWYDKSLESIEEYSQLFKKNFSKLILESRQQVLEETNRKPSVGLFLI